MEPVDYLRALRARWRLIALMGAVGLVAAWVTTPARPAAAPATVTSYTARHTLVQESPAYDAQQPVDLSSVALLVRAGDVPKRVVEKLGLREPAPVVAARVSAQADPQTRSISISVTDTDGQRAADIANAFATETIAYMAERERAQFDQQVNALSEEIARTQSRYSALETRASAVSDDRQAFAAAERDAVLSYLRSLYQRSEQLIATGPRPAGLVTLEEATPVPIAQGGFQPPASRAGRMLIAGPLGLVLGAALAVLLKRVDPRVASKEEAEAAFGLPVVAEIPVLRPTLRRRYHVAAASDDPSPVAEAYRVLRTSVRLMPLVTAGSPGGAEAAGGAGPAAGSPPPDDEARQVLLVTSPAPGEGKSSTVANLAASFARTGDSVLVLDFDHRRPEVHRYLGVGERARSSVRSLPVRPAELDAVAVRSAIPGVRLATGWVADVDGGELLDSGRSMIVAAREVADVVIVDTPPLLLTNEASELIPFVDAVIVVGRAGRTSAEAAGRASELLARLRATVLGVVLVAVRQPFPGRRYYGYRYAPRPEGPPPPGPDGRGDQVDEPVPDGRPVLRPLTRIRDDGSSAPASPWPRPAPTRRKAEG